MKKTIKVGVAAIALFFSVVTASRAQSTQPKSSSDRSSIILSVGPDANLPLGDFKNGFNWSIGGSIQGDFAIVKRSLYVSVNAGYDNFYAVHNGTNLQLVPVKAGFKYFPVANLYVQALAGVSFVANKSDVGATNSAVFAYSPQVGYLIPLGGKNYLDAGAKFEGDGKFVTGGTQSNFLGLHVAYTFGL